MGVGPQGSLRAEELILSNCGAGENSWESLEQQEDQPVNPKGNQPRIFIGRTDAKAEALMLWPADAKSQLTGTDPDAGEDWGQGEKGTTDGWIASLTQWTRVWTSSSR